MTEDRFYADDLHDSSLADLNDEISMSIRHKGRLVAIVDDEGGGIIAYAIGDDHASTIVAALQAQATR